MNGCYKNLVFLLLSFVAGNLYALEKFPYMVEENIQLALGNIETLKANDVQRIAVGNEDLISVSVLNTNEVLLIPLAVGFTDIILWHPGNRKTMIHASVKTTKPEFTQAQIQSIIQDSPGLKLLHQNDQFIVKGWLNNEQELTQIKEQISQSGAQSHVTIQVHFRLDSQLEAIQSMLSHIKGMTFSVNDGFIVAKGNYDPRFREQVQLITSRFPQMLMLATENLAPERKMIEIAVQILEIKQRNLERMGIRWQEILSGPSLAFSQQTTSNPYFSAYSDIGSASSLVENIPLNDENFYGAIGIATQIQSQIELLKETGGARVLAKPMLSTTENSMAVFHSGGQLPFPVTSASGDLSVEYKPFGIQLEVLPILGDNSNIMIDFTAEVSSIDNAISVNGVPGLATRLVTSVANTQPGQTILVSGLVSKEDNASSSKLPLLGDIPILGRLFQSRTKDLSQQELVIMLTPSIKSHYLSDDFMSASESELDALGTNLLQQFESEEDH